MSSSKKYELDLAYQKEQPLTNETRALRYTDLSRMVGRNFNQLFEQSMRFDVEGEEDKSKDDNAAAQKTTGDCRSPEANAGTSATATEGTKTAAAVAEELPKKEESQKQKERHGGSRKQKHQQPEVGDMSGSKK